MKRAAAAELSGRSPVLRSRGPPTPEPHRGHGLRSLRGRRGEGARGGLLLLSVRPPATGAACHNGSALSLFYTGTLAGSRRYGAGLTGRVPQALDRSSTSAGLTVCLHRLISRSRRVAQGAWSAISFILAWPRRVPDRGPCLKPLPARDATEFLRSVLPRAPSGPRRR